MNFKEYLNLKDFLLYSVQILPVTYVSQSTSAEREWIAPQN